MYALGIIVLKLLLCLVGLSGLLILPFGLPGNWLLVLAALPSPWLGAEWRDVWLILGAAVLAEICEFVSSILAAKQAGAGKAGMWGAFVGSLVGAIAATPILPPLGTLFGAAAGAFAGAVIFESGFAGRDSQASLKAGFGAFLGTMLGRLLKLCLGVFQLVWLAASLWGLV